MASKRIHRPRGRAALGDGGRHQGFLLKLSDAFRPLADPVAVRDTATRLLAEQLGASRVQYVEAEGDPESPDAAIVAQSSYGRELPPVAGRFRMADFGRATTASLRKSITVVRDVHADPTLTPAERARYEDLGVAAWLGVPLVKDGRFVAALVVHQSAPRAWTPEDVRLAQEAAERTWDAVERARAETALQNERALLSAVLEKLPVGVWIADRTGQLIRKNEAADRIWQGDAPLVDSIAAYPRYAAWYADTGRRLEPDEYPLARALETGREVEPLELRIRRFDGSEGTVLVSAAAIRDRHGRQAGAVGLNVDITRRKQTEQRLARHGAVLAGIARIFHQALTCETEEELGIICLAVAEDVTHSKFGFIAELDPSTGKLDDIAISDPGWELCRMTDRSGHGKKPPRAFEVTGICGSVLREGKGFFTNEPNAHPDSRGTPEGHPPLTAFLGVPLMHGGRTIGILSLANRPGGYGAEELEAAERLAPAIVQALVSKRAEQALLEADRRKNEFLGVLSHELRNPLAPIKNALYILERAAPGGDQARRAQAVITRQVDQLAHLVDDLLDVTRISHGKIQLRRERLELGELVRSTVEDHQPIFEKAGILVTLEPAPRPLQVDADPYRLAQVIGNLLQNAAKFTPAGGMVTVSVSAGTRQAAVRVVDTGAGMSPEMLARLFEPFAQADTTLDRSKGGLGLGLALVKALVEQHGGSVEGKSAGVGRGSELTVRLPLDVAATVPPEREHARRAKVRRRILVIEDNVDAAESLKEVLELDGHEVAVAHDGPAGIAQARELRPEIVLCDVGLPGADGYAVARALRADASLKDVRLVALSGYASPEDLQRAVEAGFERHLAKPPSIEKLEAAIEERTRP